MDGPSPTKSRIQNADPTALPVINMSRKSVWSQMNIQQNGGTEGEESGDGADTFRHDNYVIFFCESLDWWNPWQSCLWYLWGLFYRPRRSCLGRLFDFSPIIFFYVLEFFELCCFSWTEFLHGWLLKSLKMFFFFHFCCGVCFYEVLFSLMISFGSSKFGVGVGFLFLTGNTLFDFC